MGPYWPPERKHAENGYQALALPIDEYAVPPFEMIEDWTARQFIGYIRSWSAVARYIEARGEAGVSEFEAELLAAWGEPTERRRIRFPLHFRVGEVRKPASAAAGMPLSRRGSGAILRFLHGLPHHVAKEHARPR